MQRVLLTLNNNYPSQEGVSLTLYTVAGQALPLPAIVLKPDESRLFQLDDLLVRTGIFQSLGYLKITYTGALMGVGAQLTLYPSAGEGGLDSARSLSVDFAQARRTAVAWMPHASTATIAYSNVSDSAISVTSRLAGETPQEFTTEPHATRLDVVSSDSLDHLQGSLPLSHDLTFSGPSDGLRIAGYIAPQSGSPLPIRYYDPSIATAAHLTAVGLDTSDTAHVSLYNALSVQQVVTPEIRASTDTEVAPVLAWPVTLPPHSAAYLDIEGAAQALVRAGVAKATLTIATSAPVGALVGSLSEESQEAFAVKDIPLRTSNDPAYMRGFYPLRWTSDYVNRPMVTNASSVPKTVLAYVTAGGITYNLQPIALRPYATHIYDVDTLRTSQTKDNNGRQIPLSAKVTCPGNLYHLKLEFLSYCEREDGSMKKSRCSEEQIIGILKQSEAGVKTPDLCREHGISAATFYGWKQKFGGMDVSEAQRLKAMEDENRRLKLLVAELSLHGEALKAVIRKNGWSLPV